MAAAFLLDSNVLIALFWPAHESHDASQRWFAKNARRGWATCTFTEAAFVRIVSNPAFSRDAVPPKQAIELLDENLSHPGHSYLQDDTGFVQVVRSLADRIQGHRQVTDAYLLGLAMRYKARLATLDHAIAELLPQASRHDALELIPLGLTHG